MPHVLKSDVGSNVSSHMISLFFSLDSFGEEFFNLPEFQKVKAFLSNISHMSQKLFLS